MQNQDSSAARQNSLAFGSAGIFAGLAMFMLSGCSGGGGGGGVAAVPDDNAPYIVHATFRGASSTPADGESLILTLSEPMKFVAGSAFNGADVILSAGTLGTLVNSPVLLNSRQLAITLGAGVDFTPGTDSIMLDSNDALADLADNLGVGGAPVVIEASDGDLPTLTQLTVADIPDELNGRGPAGGTLQAYRDRFSISLEHADASSFADGRNTMISANVTVVVDGELRFPGENFADALTASGNTAVTQYLVRNGVVFPNGPVTITAFAVDSGGEVSVPMTFGFRCVDRLPQLLPFESGQNWFLDFTRDVERYTTTTLGSSVVNVPVIAGANGTSDFEDLLALIGLQSTTPIADVEPGIDSNQYVMQLFRAQYLSELQSLYAGTSVTFTYTAPGAFPGVTTVPYAGSSFSQICIGGSAAASGASGILGAALIDSNNQSQENNCLLDHLGQRLGVFVHTIVRFGYMTGPASSFRQAFDPLTPSISGTPVGDDAQDPARLLDSGFDVRAGKIHDGITMLARMLAVITAHECGHSVGLVANGAMPAGLYGNDPINFPLAGSQPDSNADYHIENTSLFPGPAQNVMSPSISFDSAQAASTSFNPLNKAYLEQQVVNSNQ